MQKIEKKASILIWSIFISLVILMTFISISTKINKNIHENKNFSNKIIEVNDIQNEVNNQIETKVFENKSIGNYKLVFEDNNKKIIGLKVNEEISLFFSENQNITISTGNSGIIKYKNSDNSKGTIYGVSTFLAPSGETIIKNIGGYTKIEITSEKEFETNEKKYKIIKIIGNKQVEKTSNTIKLN